LLQRIDPFRPGIIDKRLAFDNNTDYDSYNDHHYCEFNDGKTPLAFHHVLASDPVIRKRTYGSGIRLPLLSGHINTCHKNGQQGACRLLLLFSFDSVCTRSKHLLEPY
jgi:hypothetical protein